MDSFFFFLLFFDITNTGEMSLTCENTKRSYPTKVSSFKSIVFLVTTMKYFIVSQILHNILISSWILFFSSFTKHHPGG